MPSGTVYTETVIYSAAEAFAADVPFQTAIVTLDDTSSAASGPRGFPRIMGRILGDRVAIGDHVIEVETRDGVPFFQKT
jgi:uncharacterized OB-fold protein